jgi:hypothetical protein
MPTTETAPAPPANSLRYPWESARAAQDAGHSADFTTVYAGRFAEVLRSCRRWPCSPPPVTARGSWPAAGVREDPRMDELIRHLRRALPLLEEALGHARAADHDDSISAIERAVFVVEEALADLADLDPEEN